jgi:hypothetical protein
VWLASRRRATDFSERARGVHRGCTDRATSWPITRSSGIESRSGHGPLIWNSIEASLCCFQLFQECRQKRATLILRRECEGPWSHDGGGFPGQQEGKTVAPIDSALSVHT